MINHFNAKEYDLFLVSSGVSLKAFFFLLFCWLAPCFVYF